MYMSQEETMDGWPLPNGAMHADTGNQTWSAVALSKGFTLGLQWQQVLGFTSDLQWQQALGFRPMLSRPYSVE